MIGVKHKVRFGRQGLFAKYVLALVGLVVFVLAVNGALETWISYRATKTTLTDAMSEKAEATVETHRAIDLRPRTPGQLGDPRLRRDAGAAPRRLCATAQRRAGGAPARLDLEPGPRIAAAVAHLGHGFRRRGFFPRHALYRDPDQGRQLRAGRIPRLRAHDVDLGVAFRLQRRHHAWPTSTSASSRNSSAMPRSARPPLPMWWIPAAGCWRVRPRAPRSARTFRHCRRSPP